MFDKMQNMGYDIEIKEELLVDFSEIDNQNLQNKNNNFGNEIQNKFVKSVKPSNLTKICSVKVENENLCNNLSKSLLEDQNIAFNNIEIKQEKLDENIEIKQEPDPLIISSTNINKVDLPKFPVDGALKYIPCIKCYKPIKVFSNLEKGIMCFKCVPRERSSIPGFPILPEIQKFREIVYPNQTHEQEKTCHLCDQVLKGTLNFMKHLKIVHKIHKCEMCSAAYKSAGFLNNHMEKVHEGGKNYKCDVSECNKYFSSAEKLNFHIKTVHGYKCDKCEKAFIQLDLLKIHVKTVHEVQKGYKCNLCNKDFATNNYLKKHKRLTHEGIKNEEEQNYLECHICEKDFASKEDLKSHMRKHMKIEKIHGGFEMCNLCPKVFYHRYHLKHHITTVHEVSSMKIVQDGKRPYRCKICDKAYINVGYLNNHIKKVHEGRKD